MITVAHLDNPAAHVRALEQARARLAATQPADYQRETDFRRVHTARLHKVRRLEMRLRDE